LLKTQKMKKNITLLALFAFCLNCIGQNKIIQNDDIQFEFDDSNWHRQDPQQVLNIQKEYGQKKQVQKEEIVAVYTYDQEPAYNLPAIQIINKKTDSAPLLIEKFEEEYGSLDDNQFEKVQSVNLDFFKPTIIKSKKLILVESVNKMHGLVNMKIRQALFCLDHNLIMVQFAYLNERDTKYIEDFNRIVNSISFD